MNFYTVFHFTFSMTDLLNSSIIKLFTTSIELCDLGLQCLKSSEVKRYYHLFEIDRIRAHYEIKAKVVEDERAELKEIEQEFKVMSNIKQSVQTSTAHKNSPKFSDVNDKIESRNDPLKFAKDKEVIGLDSALGRRLEDFRKKLSVVHVNVAQSVRQLNALRHKGPRNEVRIEVGTKNIQQCFEQKLEEVFSYSESLIKLNKIMDFRAILCELELRLNYIFNRAKNITTIGETAIFLQCYDNVIVCLNLILTNMRSFIDDINQKCKEDKECVQESLIEKLIGGQADRVDYRVMIKTGSRGLSLFRDLKSSPIVLRLIGCRNEATEYFDLNEKDDFIQSAQAYKRENYLFNGKKLNSVCAVEIVHVDGCVKEWDIEFIKLDWMDNQEKRSLSFPVFNKIAAESKDSSITVYITQMDGILKHLPYKLTKKVSKGNIKGYTHAVLIGTKVGWIDKLTSIKIEIYAGNITITENIATHNNMFDTKREDKLYFNWPSTKTIDGIGMAVLNDELNSWVCSHVKIVDLKENRDYFFQINCILGSRLLHVFPGASLDEGKTKYWIYVKTGDQDKVGFHHGNQIVFVQFSSDIVSGPALKLERNNFNSNPFMRNNIDIFQLHDVIEIPDIAFLEIWHNGKQSDSWFCEWIKIEDMKARKEFIFKFEKLITGDNEIQKYKGKLIKSASFEYSHIEMLEKVKADIYSTGAVFEDRCYMLTVQSGTRDNSDFSGAGTVVCVVLQGKHDCSRNFRLSNSLTNKTPFGPGQRDVFALKFVEPMLGQIDRLCLDITGDSRWFCEKIELQKVDENCIITFPVNRWLYSKSLNKKIRINLCKNIEPNFQRPSIFSIDDVNDPFSHVDGIRLKDKRRTVASSGKEYELAKSLNKQKEASTTLKKQLKRGEVGAGEPSKKITSDKTAKSKEMNEDIDLIKKSIKISDAKFNSGYENASIDDPILIKSEPEAEVPNNLLFDKDRGSNSKENLKKDRNTDNELTSNKKEKGKRSIRTIKDHGHPKDALIENVIGKANFDIPHSKSTETSEGHNKNSISSIIEKGNIEEVNNDLNAVKNKSNYQHDGEEIKEDKAEIEDNQSESTDGMSESKQITVDESENSTSD